MSIEIELEEPVDVEYNTVEAVEILSAKEREIHVSYEGSRLFSMMVPKGVYNPYKSVAAPTLMELIMNGDIDVAGKRFLDLGCGSGVIGITAAIKEAKSVLYTDINPTCMAIRDHPLFRGVDRVTVDDFCKNERGASIDMAVMSIPAIVVDRPIDDPSIFRHASFVPSMVACVERLLASGGEFVCFFRIYFEHIPRFTDMLKLLNRGFDLDSLTHLYQNVEKKGVAAIISIRKK